MLCATGAGANEPFSRTNRPLFVKRLPVGGILPAFDIGGIAFVHEDARAAFAAHPRHAAGVISVAVGEHDARHVLRDASPVPPDRPAAFVAPSAGRRR